MIMIIGTDEKAELARIKQHAEKNPFTMDDILDVVNDPSKGAGNFDEFTCYIPESFKVVFSIEQQVPEM